MVGPYVSVTFTLPVLRVQSIAMSVAAVAVLSPVYTIQPVVKPVVDNRLYRVYIIQPVVKPVVQPV